MSPVTEYSKGKAILRGQFGTENCFPDPAEGKRYFLYFGAANYDVVVGINGRVIGHHIGDILLLL